jgi:hypothetical protein
MVLVETVRVRAKSNIPSKEQGLVEFATKVGTKSTNNTNLPNAGTLPGDVLAAVKNYQTSLGTKGTKGTTKARSAAKQGVIDAVNHLRDHVNLTIENLPADQAKAVIESTGFPIKKHAIRPKPPIEAKFGGVSGTALLIALAAGHSAVYYFEMSTDQKSWVELPDVLKCQTTVSGLTVGTVYYFRVRARNRKGLSDYVNAAPYVAR